MLDEVASLSAPEQFSSFAAAYLDSAIRLCRVLTTSHRKATYERGSVVLYLAAHAVELFLKGAILRKAPNERFNHGLEHLHNRYCKLYPAKKFQFEMPFLTNDSGMSKAEKKMIKELAAPVVQLYRYPQDKEGKPWLGLHAFEPNSFLQVLVTLQDSFGRLINEYACLTVRSSGLPLGATKLKRSAP